MAQVKPIMKALGTKWGSALSDKSKLSRIALGPKRKEETRKPPRVEIVKARKPPCDEVMVPPRVEILNPLMTQK